MAITVHLARLYTRRACLFARDRRTCVGFGNLRRRSKQSLQLPLNLSAGPKQNVGIRGGLGARLRRAGGGSRVTWLDSLLDRRCAHDLVEAWLHLVDLA